MKRAAVSLGEIHIDGQVFSLETRQELRANNQYSLVIRALCQEVCSYPCLCQHLFTPFCEAEMSPEDQLA